MSRGVEPLIPAALRPVIDMVEGELRDFAEFVGSVYFLQLREGTPCVPCSGKGCPECYRTGLRFYCVKAADAFDSYWQTRLPEIVREYVTSKGEKE